MCETNLLTNLRTLCYSYAWSCSLYKGGTNFCSGFISRKIAGFLLDPHPTEGPIKICLSICLSIHQLGKFLRNDSLVFSDNWIFQNWLSWKVLFCPNLGKKGPKWCQNKIFGNNLQWKLTVLLIFHHQSHVWQNCGSWVIDQNSVSQSNARISENVIS